MAKQSDQKNIKRSTRIKSGGPFLLLICILLLPGCGAKQPTVTSILEVDQETKTAVLTSNGTTSKATWKNEKTGDSITIEQDPIVYVDGILENMYYGTLDFAKEITSRTTAEVKTE